MSTNQQHPPTIGEKLTIAMIGFFAFLQVYSIQAILPDLMQALQASEVQIGVAVGATVLAIAVMSPFMGMLSDAFGRKPLIVGSLLLLSLPTAMIGMSSSAESLSLWRFLQGLSIPGISVVLIAYIGEEYRNHLTTMMSLYVAGTVFGGFSGRFLAGYLHHFIGWRWGYVAMALMTLIGMWWVSKFLPPSAHFVKNPNLSHALALLRQHSKNRFVLSACALGGCVLFSLVGCFTFINLHLAEKPYQLGSAQLANVFTVYLIGMVITPLSAKVIARFGMTATMIGAIGTSMFGLCLTMSTPLWLIIIGLAIMSSGVFVTQSATISYIASHVNQGRSLASGLYYLSYYGGGSIGAWLCALAYASGQWTHTVWLILFVQTLSITIIIRLMKDTP